jgi:branched-chain amino acid transport system permease protein
MDISASMGELAAKKRPSMLATVPRSIAPLAFGLILALVLHTLVVPAIGPFYAKVLTDIGINIVLAVSLNLVNGYTGQFSIGHAGFMAVGGYTAAAITYYASLSWWGSPAVNLGAAGDLLFLSSCLAGGVVAAILGFVVGLPSLRLRGDYLAIVTLGFGEIVRVLIQRTEDVLFSADEVRASSWWSLLTKLGGSLGFTGVPFYTNVFWVYGFVTLTLLVALRLKYSTYGRAFLSIRENEIAAEAMGINTTKYKVRAFVLSALFAGIAGALFAHEVGTTLNPRELGFQKSFDVVIMVVLGGMGSVSGAVLAAALLTILPEALRTFADYRMIIFAASLVVMMIVRPQGLLGLREVWELGPVARLLERLRQRGRA